MARDPEVLRSTEPAIDQSPQAVTSGWGRQSGYHLPLKNDVNVPSPVEANSLKAALNKRRERDRAAEEAMKSLPRFGYVASEQRSPVAEALTYPTFDLAPRANAAALVPDASGLFVAYNSGVSPVFLLMPPHNFDRLLLHVEFFDADGKPQYLVLRNLGNLDPTDWQRFQATLGLSAGTVSAGFTNGWVSADSLKAVNGRLLLIRGTPTAVSMTSVTLVGSSKRFMRIADFA